MPAKTKKSTKFIKTTTRRFGRKLTKKRARQSLVGRLLRSTVIVLATVSTGSLAYAIAITPTPRPAGSPDQSGRASWYAYGLLEPDAVTCASRTFGRGSYLRVKDLNNGRTVTCLVNDYGPEVWTGRVIDLSRGAFTQVDSLSSGVIPVEIYLAGGPSGVKVPLNLDISRAVGYDWCHLSHDGQFCDAHRQDAR